MEYFIIAGIGFLAFFLKGITGTGVSTVIVALSTFLIEPKLAVVLASFVNVFGGFSMLRVDPVPLPRRFWITVAVTMFIGAIVGAITLKIIDNEVFKVILGVAFILVSLQFFFRAGNGKDKECLVPEFANLKDIVVGLFSGFCGGFIGINAPPLVLHFGSYLNKQYLRRLLVLIFIPAAIVQTLIFYGTGLLNPKIMIYGLAILPMMVLGIYLGNKAHHVVSERLFKQIIAVFLMIVSVKLIAF